MRAVARSLNFLAFFALITASLILLGCPEEPEEVAPQDDVGVADDTGTDEIDTGPQEPTNAGDPQDAGPGGDDAGPGTGPGGDDAGPGDNDTGPGPDCTTDAECDDGVCVAGECYDCEEDAHCPDGFCVERQCVECLGNSQCDHFCVDNRCVDCTEDSHCGLDELCGEAGLCEFNPDCDVADFPDAENFEDLNCDGVDGDASVAIFVAPHGDDSDDGSATSPVQTINRGIELARLKSDRREVYIAEGVYQERVDLRDPVSLYGGYRDNGDGTWGRSAAFETVIAGDGSALGHRAVEIRGVNEDITLELLTIQAPDASTVSLLSSGEYDEIPGSSIGVLLSHNGGLVHVSHSVIEAGRGANGANGDDGAIGEPGANGASATGTGSSRGPTTSVQSCSFEVDDYSSQEQPHDGGAGGFGGSNAQFDGTDGSDAENTDTGHSSAAGGAAGRYFVDPNSLDACPLDGGGTLPEGNADDGEDASGNLGSSRSEYDAAGNAQEMEPMAAALLGLNDIRGDGSSRHFLLGAAIDPTTQFGRPGFRGNSGGGGGGGGTILLKPSTGTVCERRHGGAGGAGGAGGCGGQGGYFGGWAGASVGVLAYQSDVQLSSVEIHTDDGGRGGSGGDGGNGGSGGSGGQGYQPDGDTFLDGFHGGDGGDGLPGGRGAPAPGGPGGASVGIVHHDTTLTTDDLSFELGDPGQGGLGAGDDNDGLPGISAEIFEIQ